MVSRDMRTWIYIPRVMSRYSRLMVLMFAPGHALPMCLLLLLAAGCATRTSSGMTENLALRAPRTKYFANVRLERQDQHDAIAFVSSMSTARIKLMVMLYRRIQACKPVPFASVYSSHYWRNRNMFYGCDCPDQGLRHCPRRESRAILRLSSSEVVVQTQRDGNTRSVRDGGNAERNIEKTMMAAEGHLKLRLGEGKVEVCRVVNGLVQEVSDDRTGDDPTDALRAMDRLVEAGFTTFQLGNSLGGGRELAEKRVGAYLKSATGASSQSGGITFLTTLGLRRGVPVTRRAVMEGLEKSFRRMGVERLDLVQLCWRDFEDLYFLDALYYLQDCEGVSAVGVCGFGAASLALAQKNGLEIVSNLVPSSLIRSPPGGIATLRQCRQQDVAVISSRASVGGLASQNWLYRSAPRGDMLDQEPLALRQALSDIYAWGHKDKDAWHLYQSRVLPALEAVARKHGRGHTMADVATAFHLCRSSPDIQPNGQDPENIVIGGDGSTNHNDRDRGVEYDANHAAAMSIPVRVKSGTMEAKGVASQDAEISGRRGAELVLRLQPEDLDLIAEAVNAGVVLRDVPEKRFAWEEDDLDGSGMGEEEEDDGTWGGPMLFM